MTRPKALKLVSPARLNTSRVSDSSRFPERARRVSAVALTLFVLWGGGFACLWCCASDLPKGCCDKHSASVVHITKLPCASNRRSCEPPESNQHAAMKAASQPAATHCCLIGAHTNGPAALRHAFNQQLLAPAPNQPSASFTYTPAASPPICNALPTNKGSTYLRCCVLLI